MAFEVRILVLKAYDLSLTPRICMVEGGSQFLRLFSDLQVKLWHTCSHTQVNVKY